MGTIKHQWSDGIGRPEWKKRTDVRDRDVTLIGG